MACPFRDAIGVICQSPGAVLMTCSFGKGVPRGLLQGSINRKSQNRRSQNPSSTAWSACSLHFSLLAIPALTPQYVKELAAVCMLYQSVLGKMLMNLLMNFLGPAYLQATVGQLSLLIVSLKAIARSSQSVWCFKLPCLKVPFGLLASLFSCCGKLLTSG